MSDSDAKEIWLHLDPALISADEFLQSVRSFLRLIETVSGEYSRVHDGEKAKLSVRVAEGSTEVGCQIQGRFSAQIERSVLAGLGGLNRESKRPKYYTNDGLKQVINLGRSISKVGGHIRGDDSQRVKVDLFSSAHAESILGKPREDMGSIEGELRLISDVNGKAEIGIIEELSGRFIRCSFKPEFVDDLAPHFHKRVLLSGFLTYARDGAISKVKVEKYRLLGEGHVPSADEVRGILRDH